MISAIVAVNEDWGIGYNGDLLEHIPEDLKYFKKLTTDNIVVMGRKTWDSLPIKPLPRRTNIVITKNPRVDFNAFFWSMNTIKTMLDQHKGRDLNFFIIGGQSVYEQLLPLCNRVYVTKIFKSHQNVDSYFPNLDKMSDWAPAACSPIYEYKDFAYQFWQYDKIV